jgi:hypothetical protein
VSGDLTLPSSGVATDEVKSPVSKRRTSSITRRHITKGNGTEGKMPQKVKGLNISKAQGLNPKATLSRKGLPSKGANSRGMSRASPKGHVSIAMKWGTTPKIAPNLNWGLEARR